MQIKCAQKWNEAALHGYDMYDDDGVFSNLFGTQSMIAFYWWILFYVG